jgi:hypothetical protein
MLPRAISYIIGPRLNTYPVRTGGVKTKKIVRRFQRHGAKHRMWRGNSELA